MVSGGTVSRARGEAEREWRFVFGGALIGLLAIDVVLRSINSRGYVDIGALFDRLMMGPAPIAFLIIVACRHVAASRVAESEHSSNALTIVMAFSMAAMIVAAVGPRLGAPALGRMQEVAHVSGGAGLGLVPRTWLDRDRRTDGFGIAAGLSWVVIGVGGSALVARAFRGGMILLGEPARADRVAWAAGYLNLLGLLIGGAYLTAHAIQRLHRTRRTG